MANLSVRIPDQLDFALEVVAKKQACQRAWDKASSLQIDLKSTTCTKSSSLIKPQKLTKLDNKIQQKIISYLEQPFFAKKSKIFGKPLLHDKKGSWRYRIGDYRIICQIIERELVVLALNIGHRKEIYRT